MITDIYVNSTDRAHIVLAREVRGVVDSEIEDFVKVGKIKELIAGYEQIVNTAKPTKTDRS